MAITDSAKTLVLDAEGRLSGALSGHHRRTSVEGLRDDAGLLGQALLVESRDWEVKLSVKLSPDVQDVEIRQAPLRKGMQTSQLQWQPLVGVTLELSGPTVVEVTWRSARTRRTYKETIVHNPPKRGDTFLVGSRPEEFIPEG